MGNILLVIGAGASYELSMPLGQGLITRIAESIDYNPNFRPENGEGQFSDLINQFFEFKGIGSSSKAQNEQNKLLFDRDLHALKKGLEKWAEQGKSLDSFLNQPDTQPLAKEFGKFAIAYYIIGQEEWLMRENLYAFKDNWMRHFINIHLQPIKKDLLKMKIPVSIITFNYDRIIEHFLYNFLRHTEPKSNGWISEAGTDESRDIVEGFKIIHVYEKLADLEWQSRGSGSIRFGERNNDKGSLTIATSAVRLIAETGSGRIANQKVKVIQNVVNEAKTIYFLGFSFDQDNMKLLFDDSLNGKRNIAELTYQATACNLPKIVKETYPFIHYHDLTCAKLVSDTNIFRIS